MHCRRIIVNNVTCIHQNVIAIFIAKRYPLNENSHIIIFYVLPTHPCPHPIKLFASVLPFQHPACPVIVSAGRECGDVKLHGVGYHHPYQEHSYYNPPEPITEIKDDYNIQSTLDISKSKFIPNYWYLKANFNPTALRTAKTL